jgi:hypothetical protein
LSQFENAENSLLESSWWCSRHAKVQFTLIPSAIDESQREETNDLSQRVFALHYRRWTLILSGELSFIGLSEQSSCAVRYSIAENSVRKMLSFRSVQWEQPGQSICGSERPGVHHTVFRWICWTEFQAKSIQIFC